MLQSENSFHTAWQKRRKARLRNERIKRYAGIILSIAMAFALMWALARVAIAGDPTGKWADLIAKGKAPPAQWWNGLASGKGLCCSFADGVAIEDVEWDTGGPGGQYRVWLHSAWYLVPETALVTEPNRYGPAVVWPYEDVDGSTRIRCFLPGAGA
jgi:hypothetical protein